MRACGAALALVALAIWAAPAVAFAFRVQPAIQPVAHAEQNISIYQTAGVVYHDSLGSASAVGAAFAHPSVVNGVTVGKTGAASAVSTLNLTSKCADPCMLAVATARHVTDHDAGINITHPGRIDTAVAFKTRGSTECYVAAFSSLSPTTLAWQATVKDCLINDLGMGNVLGFADQGQRVVLVTAATPPNASQSQADLHVFEASTGKRLCLSSTVSEATGLEPQSLSLSYSAWHLTGAYYGGPGATGVDACSWAAPAERAAFTFGDYFVVINTTTARGSVVGGKPVFMGYRVLNAHMCPMGVFLSFGFVDTAVVHMWNSEANAFQYKWNTTGPTHGGPWLLESSTMSVNGEDMNVYGCVVAFGWTNGDVSQAAVTAFAMLTQKQFLSWTSPVSPLGQNPPVALSMDLGYLAVGCWGSENASASVDTLYVFSITTDDTATPLLAYQTPGSVFAVSIAVDPFKYPPLLARTPHVAAGTDTIWVAAAGKHVHANKRGDGGDFFLFRFDTPAARSQPSHH